MAQRGISRCNVKLHHIRPIRDNDYG